MRLRFRDDRPTGLAMLVQIEPAPPRFQRDRLQGRVRFGNQDRSRRAMLNRHRRRLHHVVGIGDEEISARRRFVEQLGYEQLPESEGRPGPRARDQDMPPAW